VTRFVISLLAFAGAALGQFAGLGVTGDGATLYFSTPLRLRGSASPFNHKILRYDTQLTEFLSRDTGMSNGHTTENFYDLIAAQPSSDGSIIGISAYRSCYGGSGCLAVQRYQSTILDRTGKQLFVDYGLVSLSRDGRWGLFYGRDGFGGLVPATELVNLTTAQATTVPYQYSFSQRSREVANDGTVAVVVGSELHLWRTDGERTLPGASPLPAVYPNDPQVLISADGRRVVYQTATGLALYDGTETALTTTPVTWASISDDGSVIAFVNSADAQVWMASPLRQLTKEADGMTEIALSGDGKVVYAATNGGRLLRIDVASAAVTELIPRTPWITGSTSPVVPGSLYQFTGQHLSPARVRIGGLDAPVQASTADQISFQVPWETPVQDAATFELISGSSPLESPPGTLPVVPFAPGSFTTDFTTLAVHQDFSGLITPTSPAVAGEVIAVYLNGLGAVAPTVGTGAPGPVPPAVVTAPLRCQFWDGGPNDGHIFFAGLAPGMLGVYQVSVQVPAGLRVTPVSLSCDAGQDTLSVFGLLPVKL
jgi:uncharacterized protein (TIGR03437 family)